LEIKLDITDFDATVFRIVENLMVEGGVVEERLRRNAANIETSAPERASLLYTRHLHNGLDTGKVTFEGVD
jgi:hypothetical protein